ncbi:hypothetical protein [Halocatena salina]|uniref:Uncharacterized protein n=1 Tax=Halocatena salina TaxID=2934340 RepID=A0A8T9ZZR9_9EURY|nr:hypothetical protein [Halocatena salina]UPM41959.1 hypothetical protein MW046_08240 [Halocatena salina]
MVDWHVPPDETSARRLFYEVLIGVLAVLSPVVWLVGEWTVVWPWVGYGGGSIVVGYAVSRTAVGHSIDAWFTRIGPGGRFRCLLLVTICVWSGLWTIEPHVPSVMSFVCGAVVLLLTVSIIRLCNRVLAR